MKFDGSPIPSANYTISKPIVESKSGKTIMMARCALCHKFYNWTKAAFDANNAPFHQPRCPHCNVLIFK